jgi:hypothetical protein
VLTLLPGDGGALRKSFSFSKNSVSDNDIPALTLDLNIETVGKKWALGQTEKHFIWPLSSFPHKRIRGQISFCIVHPIRECVTISNTFRFHPFLAKSDISNISEEFTVDVTVITFQSIHDKRITYPSLRNVITPFLSDFW